MSTIAEFIISPDNQHGDVLFAMELWDAEVSKLNSYHDIDMLKEAFFQTITAGYKHLPIEAIDYFYKADLDDYLSRCELLKGEIGNAYLSLFGPPGIVSPGSGKFISSIYPRLGVLAPVTPLS